jgi:hypothetical protein
MKKLNTIKLVALTVCGVLIGQASLSAQTQTGPGGVGNSSNIAVWLDAGTLNLNNGDPVATWTDRSGNGNNFTQSNASIQPTFSQTGLVNGRPAVTFTSDVISSSAISALNTDVLSYFIVYRNQSALTTSGAGQFAQLLSTRSSINNGEWMYQLKRENGNLVRVERYARESTSAFKVAPSDLNNTENLSPAIGNAIWRSSNAIYGQWNGAKAGSASGAVSSGFSHVLTNLGALLDASNNLSRFFTGDISEVIIISNEINSAQEKIVYNHLSAKYGITLGGGAIYAHNATHPNEVAGIGRDNVSNQHLSARGTDIIEVSAGALDDGDFLLWGHDGASLTTQTADVPNEYIQFLGERISRVWRVTEVGETGNLTIVVDVTGLQFGNPNDYELLIDADGIFSTGATRISGVLTGDLITFTVTGAELYNGAYFTLGNSKNSYIYTIANGQNWNDPTTWNCSCIPSGTDMFVAIIDGHTVNVTDAQAVGFLEVTFGTTLNIANGGSLAVKTDLMVAGMLNSQPNGTLTFDGVVHQELYGIGTVTLGNLMVNNNNSFTLRHSSYALSGILTPTSGVVDFNGVPFTFVSNATSTASIGIIGAGASFANASNIRVQRFIPTGVAGYRNMGTPLTSMALREWDDEIYISGPGFPDGCAYTTNGCFTSAKYWRADLQAYRSFTNIDSALANGHGIEIYLGDNLNTFSATTLTATGTPNVSLSTNVTVLNGWNLISNPFLSTINFSNVTRNSGNIGNYFYVYNPDTGSSEWYNNANGTSSNNWTNGSRLSAFQGFWVYNSGASSSMTFNQASKFFGVDGFFKSTESEQIVVSFKEQNSGVTLETVIGFDDESELEFDVLDMPKFPSRGDDEPIKQLYTLTADNQGVVYNSVQHFEGVQIIPLITENFSSGVYKIALTNSTDYEVKIWDINNRIFLPIKNGNNVELVINQNTENGHNYELHIYKSEISNELTEGENVTIFYAHNQLFVQSKTELTNVKLDVIDVTGKVVYNELKLGNGSYFNLPINPSNGIYLVRLTSDSGSYEVAKISILR